MIKLTNEDRHASLQMVEEAKTRLKYHFDSHVHPHTFSECDMVLVYNQAYDNLGKGKFYSMW